MSEIGARVHLDVIDLDPDHYLDDIRYFKSRYHGVCHKFATRRLLLSIFLDSRSLSIRNSGKGLLRAHKKNLMKYRKMNMKNFLQVFLRHRNFTIFCLFSGKTRHLPPSFLIILHKISCSHLLRSK